MEIGEIKREIRKEVTSFKSDREKMDEAYLRSLMESIFENWKRYKRTIVDEKTQEKIIREIIDDFLHYGPISEFLSDVSITEIMINGPYRIYIEKEGRKYLTEVKFDDEAHLRYIIERMIAPTRRRVDESFPYADFSLPDGSRVNVIIPPLSVYGPVVTIRKLSHLIKNVDDLIQMGTIDRRMGEFLVTCIRAKINILFSGATGSGKTTTVEVLSTYIDEEERIVTIEDALELTLHQEHVVRLLTRLPNIEGRGEISIRDLFINSLRMRPTRIILGEIRGSEAMDYIQALNSGHRGCLAVLHASTPEDSIMRLETMALYAGLNLPSWAIRKQIASGLNLVVQHEQLLDGSRKITYITEVVGIDENNNVILKDLFRYNIEGRKDDGKIKGKFVALGLPSFYGMLKKKGFDLKEDIFKE